MTHLFNKSEYYQFSAKFCSQIKKNLQQRIQSLAQNITDLHPIQGHDQVVVDGSQFHILYQNQKIFLPKRLLEVEDYSTILNSEVLNEYFTEQQRKQLIKLVPEQSIQNINYCLNGQGFYEKHLKQFQRKTKIGYFSILRQKEDEIMEKLNNHRRKQIYQNLLQEIYHKQQFGSHNQKMDIKQEISQLESLQDLSEIAQFSDNSYATQTEQQMKQKAQQQNLKGKIFFKYDYSKLKTQEEMLAMGEQKKDKINITYKSTVTIRPRNSQWVDNYRKQQLLRYSNPTKPWVYNCEDGRKVTVAPVAKKLSVLTGKPRDHPLLKSERPACVTILTLVRDAAARLPNGVGTRADICELLKQSQYINEDLPEDKVSNIVSGALDRLHYMSDACVKYDSQKKLWIYLHIDRNNQHPGWGEEGQEYTQKNIVKKKKKSE